MELRSWNDLHIKGTTVEVDASALPGRPRVTHVIFPLLPILLRAWIGYVDAVTAAGLPYLYLVSGSGVPRNPSHSATGNSTESTSRLMARFVQSLWPRVRVERVHSGPGIFRYHDNVTFINTQVQPILAQHHREMCRLDNEDWYKRVHVCMSLCDGTPARVTALAVALRRYRPDFFHVWQLKSFWHEQSLDGVC